MIHFAVELQSAFLVDYKIDISGFRISLDISPDSAYKTVDSQLSQTQIHAIKSCCRLLWPTAWNYTTNKNTMQENPLLHARLSFQVVHC